MSYTAAITRTNPTLLVFLIDQSGSMAEPSPAIGPGITKAKVVADILNRTLQNVIIDCTQGEGIRNYFDISLIAYGEKVGTALAGIYQDRPWVGIAEIGMNPPRIEARKQKVPDGAGGFLEIDVRFPVFFEPEANAGTPMCEAFELAGRIVDEWTEAHPAAFPPILMNFTDGQSTDGDPISFAQKVMQHRTSDGEVLVLNCHISSRDAQATVFPSDSSTVPQDPYAIQLFHMSSEIPQKLRDTANAKGIPLQPGAKGYVYQAGIEEIVRFFDIGTPAITSIPDA